MFVSNMLLKINFGLITQLRPLTDLILPHESWSKNSGP